MSDAAVSAEEMLSAFVPQKRAVLQGKTIMAGHIRGRPAVLTAAAHLPAFADFANLPHTTTLHNGIYATADVTVPAQFDISIECPASPARLAALPFGYRVRHETYAEYLRDSELEGTLLSPTSEQAYGAVDSAPSDLIRVTACTAAPGRSWRAVFTDPTLRSIRDVEDASILETALTTLRAQLPVPAHHLCTYIDIGSPLRRLHILAFDISETQSHLAYTGWPLPVEEAIRNIRAYPGFYQGTISYLETLGEEQSE